MFPGRSLRATLTAAVVFLGACGGASGGGFEELALSYGEAVAKSALEGSYEGPVGPVKPSKQNAGDPPGKLKGELGDGAKLSAVMVVVNESTSSIFWEAEALVLPDRRVVYTAFRSKKTSAPGGPERHATFPTDTAPATIGAHIDAVKARLVGACDLPLATEADLKAAGYSAGADRTSGKLDVDPQKLGAARAQACEAAKGIAAGGTRQVTFRARVTGATGSVTAHMQLQREPFGVKEWTAYRVDKR